MALSQEAWAKVRAEYEAGQLSMSEIARQAGVSRPAVSKRAKAEGWTRSLVASVRNEVARRMVTGPVTERNAHETINAAAARAVEVVRQHQVYASKQLRLAERVMDRAEEWLDDEEVRRRKSSDDIKVLQGIAQAMASSAQALAKAIPLERQAFSIPDPDKQPVQAQQTNVQVNVAQNVGVESELAVEDMTMEDLRAYRALIAKYARVR